MDSRLFWQALVCGMLSCNIAPKLRAVGDSGFNRLNYGGWRSLESLGKGLCCLLHMCHQSITCLGRSSYYLRECLFLHIKWATMADKPIVDSFSFLLQKRGS